MTTCSRPSRLLVQLLPYYVAAALLGLLTYEALVSLPGLHSVIGEPGLLIPVRSNSIPAAAMAATFAVLAVPVRFVLKRVTFTWNRVMVIGMLLTAAWITFLGPPTFVFFWQLIQDLVYTGRVSVDDLIGAATTGGTLGQSFLSPLVACLGMTALACVDRLLRLLKVGADKDRGDHPLRA